MKTIATQKKSFVILILLFFSLIYSNSTHAQRGAGGSADGLLPPQPCAVNFTRNNGDGACAGQAQIRLYFSQAPVYAPTLENILYNGEPLLTNAFPIEGKIGDLATLGYISYCLPTSNIPPAIKLTLVFRYTASIQDDCIISGTN